MASPFGFGEVLRGHCQCRGLLPAKWRAARIECAAGRRSGPRLGRTVWFQVILHVSENTDLFDNIWLVRYAICSSFRVFFCGLVRLPKAKLNFVVAVSKLQTWLCWKTMFLHVFAHGILGIWPFQAAPKRFYFSWVLVNTKWNSAQVSAQIVHVF